MKKFFHSISTMMLLVALTGMGLASCSESPEAPEDPTENPDDEDKGDGSEGEGGDENKTVELNYTVAEAAYWGDDYMEDGTSNLIVYLYDSPRDEDGVHTGPKDHFNIDMNLPNFNGGELLIPARSYPIGEPEVYAPNTLEPGFADEFEIGGVLYGDYYGVFHQVIDAEQNETYELVSDGEMTVGYENGVYTIDATFTTEEGVVYHVTYKGAITVDDESLGEPDDEDWYSTLTDDVEVDALTQGQLYYMGADDKSSLFGILLGTEGVTLSNGTGTGELMQFFVNADPDAVKELPAGKYEIVPRSAPMEPETVIEGYKEGNQLGGSWYFELEKNLTVNRAPAYEGTVTIGHTENTLDYTVDFEFYDDNLDEGYIVSGSFSGKMEYIYDAGTLQAKGGRVTAPRRPADKRAARIRR